MRSEIKNTNVSNTSAQVGVRQKRSSGKLLFFYIHFDGNTIQVKIRTF